jgi:hypothetical protein
MWQGGRFDPSDNPRCISAVSLITHSNTHSLSQLGLERGLCGVPDLAGGRALQCRDVLI